MATYNKFNQFTNDLLIARHNFASGTFKVALTNNAPAATMQTRADLADLATASGYTNGGTATTISVSTSSGVAKVTGTNVIFTSTGTIGPFQYAYLYNATSGTTSLQYLISWWDYGSAISLANTETLSVAFDASNGIFQIS